MDKAEIKKLFLNREDKDEQKETKKAFETLKKAGLKDNDIENLKYMSFLMFKPDSVASGKVKDLIKEFEKEDIHIAKLKLVVPSIEKLDQLYRLIRKKYVKIYDVITKQLSGDMIAPTILIGDPKKFSHLPERVKAMMGPTTVIIGEGKHLRYKYGGSGRGFNLMHGTDDPGISIREMLVFFTPKEILNVLPIVEKLRKGKKLDLIDADDLKKIRTLQTKIEYEISEEYAMYRMKRKIIDDLLKMADKREKEILKKLDKTLDKEKDVYKEDYDLRKRRKELLKEFAKQLKLISKYKEQVEADVYNLCLKQTGKICKKTAAPLRKKLDLSDFILACVNEAKYSEDDILQHLINLANHDVKIEVWDEILLLARRIGLDTVRKHIKEHLGEEYL